MPHAAADGARNDDSEAVFNTAADLFKLLSTPIRLKIISALCAEEKNVTQLLAEINTTQPNMSQHLAALHRAGVLSKRRDATQIHYRIGSQRAASLCRAVCLQVALEIDEPHSVPAADRLLPAQPQQPQQARKTPSRSDQTG